MLINIDTKAKAEYIKLKEGKCHHTKEVLPEVFVDFDSREYILGIELISPCTVTLHPHSNLVRIARLAYLAGSYPACRSNCPPLQHTIDI